MPRRTATILAALSLALVPLALEGGSPASAADPSAHLVCSAPTDAPAIDRMLLRAGSPLAGEGATFVRVGSENGIDPRFLVAVAAHETLLETYSPAQAIRNPFGLGPGIVYESERQSIEEAGRILAQFYLAEGLTTIPKIAAKWAPVGATNDPTNLNSHWTTGVSSYYRSLGADPEAEVSLTSQAAEPDCGTTAPDDALDGYLLWVWDGREPRLLGEGPAGGADPVSGRAARPDNFVFPLAARATQAVVYSPATCVPGSPCTTTISVAPGTPVVAAIDGVLEAASGDDAGIGIGFWIVNGEERIGYSALASYEDAISEGTPVSAGQVLGRTAERTVIGWTRSGETINPYPLLEATRPPAL